MPSGIRRLAYIVAGFSAGVALGTAVATTRAEDPQTDTQTVANKLGMDATLLQGAVNSTGLDAATYVCVVGEGPCPQPAKPPISGAVSRADCIIQKESRGRDVPNAQGSGATGPGQYFVSTWARHVALYRQATGFAGPLSLHVLEDVRRVMSFMLSAYPASRSEWAVGGC